MNKWNYQDQVSLCGFNYREPILAQRIIMVNKLIVGIYFYTFGLMTHEYGYFRFSQLAFELHVKLKMSANLALAYDK